ncbi:MAG TPA: hypothetical protein VN408_21365 [Actinoplanes sp.]|nr:hypothetical protein [Actinoplanes sp.]
MMVIRPVLAGILLALPPYAARTLVDDYDLARILTAVTGLGLLWGTTVLLTATATATRRQAIITATALLITAAVTYHLLILLAGDTRTGPGVAPVLWLAGPVLGALGHTIRHGDPRQAASAAGIGCGLLASEGGTLLIIDPPAELMEFFERGASEFYGPLHPADLIGLILPLLLLAVLATRHSLWKHGAVLLFTAATTTVGATLLWLFLLVVASHR